MSIPRALREKIESGKIIPFVGAGVSMSVRNKQTGESLFPSWSRLLGKAADRLEEENKESYAGIVRGLLAIEKPDYLDAAKRARDGLGAAIWYKLLKEHLDFSRDLVDDESLALAKTIWQLGSKLIVTTNYDRVLQWACPQQGDVRKWEIEAPAEQAGALQDGVNYPTVWHLHGHIDNAANLILTPDGYHRLYSDQGGVEGRYNAALATLRSLLASRTFLFIGFSLDDEHFGVQLQGLHDIFEGATGPHYVLVREQNRARTDSLGSNVNAVTFSNFGGPLLELVQELAAVAGESKTTAPKRETGSGSPSKVADYDPRNPVFFVPFRPKKDQVIGRADALLSVRRQLTEGRRTSIGQAAAFQGLGGLGKTQLAVEYAYEYRDAYPNGVVWLNADQSIDAQLAELAEKARWIAPESEHKFKLDVARQRLRSYSACLIIFDNVIDLKDIEEYLPEIEAEPHILITSRTEQPGFTPIPLDPLDKDRSLQLLVQEAQREPEGAEAYAAAQSIAAQLGGLPLALELAGAYLRHRPISWERYDAMLQQSLKEALAGKVFDSFTRHEADLYSTLKIQEDVFEEEPFLQRVLDLLTWSGPAPMGISLLCTLLEVEEDDAVLIDALGLGVAMRLLQESPDAKRYAIHRLVGEVRREDVPLAERLEWVDSVCQRMGDWFQERREDFTDLLDFESEIDHLRSWQRHSLQFDQVHASRLAWLNAYPSYHRGRYSEAKAILEKALTIYRNGNFDNGALLAHLLNDYGSIYSELGDYREAHNYYEQALNIRREVLGGRHPNIASSLNNLGSTYSELGDYREALKYQEQALEIRRELLGERHPETVMSVQNIAIALTKIGRGLQAIQMLNAVLNDLPNDHMHYNLIKQRKRDIQGSLKGFRSVPSPGKKRKRKRGKR